jgi:surfeit locus 1 family protein
VFGGAADPSAGPDQAKRDFWVYLDIRQIAQQLPYAVLPVYLQLGAGQGAINAPLPSEPSLDLSEGPHQGYAIQWFTFAAMLLVGYPLYVRKQERHEA